MHNATPPHRGVARARLACVPSPQPRASAAGTARAPPSGQTPPPGAARASPNSPLVSSPATRLPPSLPRKLSPRRDGIPGCSGGASSENRVQLESMSSCYPFHNQSLKLGAFKLRVKLAPPHLDDVRQLRRRDGVVGRALDVRGASSSGNNKLKALFNRVLYPFQYQTLKPGGAFKQGSSPPPRAPRSARESHIQIGREEARCRRAVGAQVDTRI